MMIKRKYDEDGAIKIDFFVFVLTFRIDYIKDIYHEYITYCILFRLISSFRTLVTTFMIFFISAIEISLKRNVLRLLNRIHIFIRFKNDFCKMLLLVLAEQILIIKSFSPPLIHHFLST